MYQLKKDPVIHNYIEEFYLFSTREMNRRNNAFGFNFETREGRRFVEEMRKLKPLEAYISGKMNFSGGSFGKESPGKENTGRGRSFAKLEQGVHFPSELNEEQLITYLWIKQDFQKGIVDKSEAIPYLKLYMLEVANDMEKRTPEGALQEIFEAYDLGKECLAKNSDGQGGWDLLNLLNLWEDYLLLLCQSFLVAHSQTASLMKNKLIERDLAWKMDPLGEILDGRFGHSDDFLREYVLWQKEQLRKGKMKKGQIYKEQIYVEAGIDTMPYVFSALAEMWEESSEKFWGNSLEAGAGNNIFSKILIPGREKSQEMELLPVAKTTMGKKRKIPYSDTCYLTEKATYFSQKNGQWFLVEGELFEGARDFLLLIQRYSESFLREIFGGPARKRTAAAFLKKKYARTGDDPRAIKKMKELLQNLKWEMAIARGVKTALVENPYIGERLLRFQQEKRRSRMTPKEREKKKLEAMDHENVTTDPIQTIDHQKFHRAKNDADQVLSLLHEGEIAYGTRGQKVCQRDQVPLTH